MKIICSILLVLSLSACSTVRGTAGGFVDGVGKDVRSVGDGLGKVAEKIKP